MYFNEPGEKEINLLPLVVHGAAEHTERFRCGRPSGLGTCGQISLCTGGKGRFFDSLGKGHIIEPGGIFYFAPEAPHSYEPVESPWNVIFILFSGCELPDIWSSLDLPPSGALNPSPNDTVKIRMLIDDIFEAYESGSVSRHIKASASLYGLLTLISELNTDSAKNHEAGVIRLIPAIRYIDSHFDNNNLTSDMIAAHSGMSHPHLCRLFSAVYGMGPHDYLVRTRVNFAKSMLAEQKNVTIGFVAKRSGFSSVSYFTKVFKAKTGLTPAQFRRQNTYDF